MSAQPPSFPPRIDELAYMSKVDAALHRSAERPSRLLLWGICLTFAVLLAWAAVAEVDEVTRGMGQIIPSMRTQVIENREGGILREILVSEGDIVEKNALLLRIDNEGAGSQVRSTSFRVLELEAAIARLEAEAAGELPVYPQVMRVQVPQIIQDQEAERASRRERFVSERLGLENQRQQQIQAIKEQKSRKTSLEAMLANAMQHRNMARYGVAHGSVSRSNLLALEKDVISLTGEIEALSDAIPKLEAAEREAAQRLSTHKAGFEAEALAEITKNKAELNQQREMLTAGQDQVKRQEVRSPVRGIVNQIHLYTRGGVVKPATPIMEIVPLDDALLVEARINPTDIAFLHPGQKGIVKITAYDFAIFGGLDASVVHISPNSIKDERGDVFYLVRLRTANSTLTHKGRELPIIPGMVASVDILTGKKTVLDYLLKPILKARQDALRER